MRNGLSVRKSATLLGFAGALSIGMILGPAELYADGCGGCSSGTSMTSAKEKSCDSKPDIVETALGAGSFKTLAAALKAANLVDALKGPGPFTVFAPTDEAFSKLPKGTVENLLKPENREALASILKYHVVAGKAPAKKVTALSHANTLNGQRVDISLADGKVRVDGATVVKADVWASNGVIHVIDSVILPSSDDIVATAVKAGKFNTLAAALKAAGLASTLQKGGPFTVFAPTDEAFSKLPEGTVESLLKPENADKLTAILKYHVVSGRVYSSDAVAAKSAATLQGSNVSVGGCESTVKINEAKVVMADIDTSNGVIHAIDSVLLPQIEEASTETHGEVSG